MSEYNRALFEQRVIARAGGNYIYNEPSLITLSRVSKGVYRVVDLFVFIAILDGVQSLKTAITWSPTNFGIMMMKIRL